MSPRSSAAIPGRGRRDYVAPTEVIAHPGTAVPLVCPACRHGEQLEYVLPGEHYSAIDAREISDGRITYPEVTVADEDSSPPEVAAVDRPSGIRCLRCRWAYRGPNPITKLVPA